MISVGVAVLIYSAVVVDAFLVEPNWPVVSTIELEGPVEAPLTILHLSDLHLEPEAAPRDGWLRAQLEELAPDMVLLTGDIHQLNTADVGSLERVLGQLSAPLGVYGCIGFDNIGLLEKANPDIVYLDNQAVFVQRGDDRIGIAGLRYGTGHREPCEALSEADYRIVLNHTPDLANEAAEHGAHLYLCGHTHGGQVRIPFWGAIVTNCESGKKYEAGLYRNRGTWIYTSRGFGLEPRPAPQVRFFCRPQITLITIRPE